jgi:protein-tyrosine-phosphatase
LYAPSGLGAKVLSKPNESYCLPEMLLGEVRLTGDYVLSLCPECEDRVVVWNVKDPYFMNREDAWKVCERIKEKVTQLAKSL